MEWGSIQAGIFCGAFFDSLTYLSVRPAIMTPSDNNYLLRQGRYLYVEHTRIHSISYDKGWNSNKVFAKTD